MYITVTRKVAEELDIKCSEIAYLDHNSRNEDVVVLKDNPYIRTSLEVTRKAFTIDLSTEIDEFFNNKGVH